MTTDSRKPDKRLGLGYGSAWHLLNCLNGHREDFNAIVARQLQASALSWLGAPESQAKQPSSTGRRILDGEWKRIKFIPDSKIQNLYKAFWPTRGWQQHWDAIGKATFSGGHEWLLIEAKSHTGEIKAGGTKAKEIGGRPQIRSAFRETLQALGHNEESSTTFAENWLAGYYQYGNRLATLHFLGKHGIPAHLVFLYFCGDKFPDCSICPANAGEWKVTLDKVSHGLGLHGASEMETRVHNVFVDVTCGQIALAG